MLLNLSIGGSWPGSPTADFLEATMSIDWVRAYSVEPDSTVERLFSPPPPPPPEPSYPYDNYSWFGQDW